MPKFGHLANLSAYAYDRGSKIVGMIEERMGEAAFLDFMRAVYAKFQFRILRVADFQRELEAFTGRSWDDFFQHWLYGAGMCDWSIEHVTIENRRRPLQLPLVPRGGPRYGGHLRPRTGDHVAQRHQEHERVAQQAQPGDVAPRVKVAHQRQQREQGRHVEDGQPGVSSHEHHRREEPDRQQQPQVAARQARPLQAAQDEQRPQQQHHEQRHRDTEALAVEKEIDAPPQRQNAKRNAKPMPSLSTRLRTPHDARLLGCRFEKKLEISFRSVEDILLEIYQQGA